MPSEVSGSLRRLIAQRANYRCEYCLLPETAALHRHEPDHIIPRQHNGETHENNLAFACVRCNHDKGPNVGSFDPFTGLLVPLFNPRKHLWSAYFTWDNATIRPLTPEGRVTITILHLNDPERVAERQQLMAVGSPAPSRSRLGFPAYCVLLTAYSASRLD
jgi:hypothetical protein